MPAIAGELTLGPAPLAAVEAALSDLGLARDEGAGEIPDGHAALRAVHEDGWLTVTAPSPTLSRALATQIARRAGRAVQAARVEAELSRGRRVEGSVERWVTRPDGDPETPVVTSHTARLERPCDPADAADVIAPHVGAWLEEARAALGPEPGGDPDGAARLFRVLVPHLYTMPANAMLAAVSPVAAGPAAAWEVQLKGRGELVLLREGRRVATARITTKPAREPPDLHWERPCVDLRAEVTITGESAPRAAVLRALSQHLAARCSLFCPEPVASIHISDPASPEGSLWISHERSPLGMSPPAPSPEAVASALIRCLSRRGLVAFTPGADLAGLAARLAEQLTRQRRRGGRAQAVTCWLESRPEIEELFGDDAEMAAALEEAERGPG